MTENLELLKPCFKVDDSIKSKRVVNIIGRAPSAGVILPYGENWAVNHAWFYGHKIDKLFVMDGVKALFEASDTEGIGKDAFIDYIKSNPTIPFINAYAEQIVADGAIIKTCEEYPLNVVTTLIPGNFFNNSIAYMLAYAAAQEKLGFEKIDIINLIGIELWFSFNASEYDEQRPCVDFWISYLYGLGVQLYVPAYTLYAKGLKNNLYGYFRK